MSENGTTKLPGTRMRLSQDFLVTPTGVVSVRSPANVMSFGAIGDGVADDATAILSAINSLGSLGGRVSLPAGVFGIRSTLALPDNVVLIGAGKNATTIKLLSGANCNIIEKKSGADGRGAGIADLTIDGNDANNTSGGIYWAGASTDRGPVFTFERVTVRNCRPIANPPSSEYAAILTTGSTWGVARDLDVNQNQYAVGWWHKGSDWQISNLYLGPNGASYPTHNMIIQGGAGNIFTAAYFGGNGGYSQVLIWGSSRNVFLGCLNDNAWQHGYLFDNSGGAASNNNLFIGGQISSSGWSTNNTYSGIRLNGAATGNLFCGLTYLGLQSNEAKYIIEEADTASGNSIWGGYFDGNIGTSFDGRRSAGTSVISGVVGVDTYDAQILVAKKRVNVTGPYDNAAVSTSSVPLLRLNNGGAVSLWAGARGYSQGWLQAIQDDGSNNAKELLLNPLGGGVRAGANLTVEGTSAKTLAYDAGVSNGSVATTLGSVGPTGANAGNPLGWLRVEVNGSARYVPYW